MSVSVSSAPKRLRPRQDRQRGDRVEVRLHVPGLRDHVRPAFAELKLGLQRFRAVHAVQKRVQQAPVFVVGDSPAVVALARRVLERRERGLVVVVHVHVQLPDADAQVAVVEAVRDVPPDRTEDSPLLHEAVAKREAEAELFENLRFSARLEKFWVRDRVELERPSHVRSQPSRGLVRHLYAVL
eukprot:30850-Pelagococcus_subviridis.AAC.2